MFLWADNEGGLPNVPEILEGKVNDVTITTLPPGRSKHSRRAGRSSEPPGALHLVPANAGTTELAELIAVFVAHEGAQLTHFVD